jgi:hypothetical protein
MDWQRAIEEERAALMRLVALLGALAGLAERAASRSPAMRGFVLWILSHAEAIARDFVAASVDAEVESMPVVQAGARSADAMRLAASLRRLARQLERQIERQAKLMLGMLAACGKRGAGIEPPPLRAMPALRGLANALSMLATLAWPMLNPAPDTS